MSERTGVIVHNPGKAHRSFTLFGPDHGDHCYLMDMDGSIVHTWYVYGIHFPRLLPNGNTFVCAGGSRDGRLFEVTPAGEVVWDFRNPFAARANGMTKIYRAYRFEPAFVEPLLVRGSET